MRGLRRAPRTFTIASTVAIASLALACSHNSGAKDGGAVDGAAASLHDAGADAGDAGTPADVDAGIAAEDALPSSIAADLTDRSRHLVEAIAHDDPTLAQDFVFPRDGYAASHDRSDASSVWDKKVLALFAHDVHALHKKIKNSAHANFIAFDLGHEVQQITPKPKDFDRPLWRVKHSKVTISVDGKTDRIDVAEMMGWRGAWYVTHLRGGN